MRGKCQAISKKWQQFISGCTRFPALLECLATGNRYRVYATCSSIVEDCNRLDYSYNQVVRKLSFKGWFTFKTGGHQFYYFVSLLLVSLIATSREPRNQVNNVVMHILHMSAHKIKVGGLILTPEIT